MRRHAALALTALAFAPYVVAAQTATDSLVRRAMSYAGGQSALSAAPALEWKGKAAIHIPGRDILLYGHWRILPPDSAIVATYEVSRGPGSTRRLVLAGPRGWLLRDSVLNPMPPAVLAEERHQFYLYSLLQVLPLQRSQVHILPAATEMHGLRIDQTGRLPVFIYFAPSGQVTRMATRFATADGTPGDSQEVRIRPLYRR